MQQCQNIHEIECGRENCVEEVPWKQNFAQLDEMSKNADLDFTNQRVVTAYVLLLHQAQLAQLLKMVLCYTRAAEPQGFLNLTNTHRTTILQKKPIHIPVFPTKSILKLNFTFRVQAVALFSEYSKRTCDL